MTDQLFHIARVDYEISVFQQFINNFLKNVARDIKTKKSSTQDLDDTLVLQN